MSDAPAAEIDIDEALVRRLVTTQAADIADLPLSLVDEGWDNQVWRLGAGWAVRLPRRRAAAPLIANEQRWLPALADRIRAAAALEIPAPAVCGRPAEGFPWPWSIVPWTEGAPGTEIAPADRGGWAAPLARGLAALHRPAPEGHPVNRFRGVPLALRDADVRARIARLRAGGGSGDPGTDGLHAAARAWDDALAAAPWSAAPVWIHGDLHPGNLIGRDGRLAAIIDFGDLTAGDPAYDLAIAWLGFTADARAVFMAASPGVDEATWRRARGWAAAVATILLERSDDRPTYRGLALDALRGIA